MNMRKLSINKACVLLGTLLLLAVGAVCTTVYPVSYTHLTLPTT